MARQLLKPLSLIAVCFVTISLSACGKAPSPVQIPFRLEEGTQIVVDARIEGAKVRLVVDSGGHELALTPAVVKRLKIKTERANFLVGGAGADVRGRGLVTLDALTVGRAVLKYPEAHVVPFPESFTEDGLLGAPFFPGRVVGVDYAAHKLTLWPALGFRAPSGFTAIPMRVRHGMPLVEATVDGLSGLFLVDTGAAGVVALSSPFVVENTLRIKYAPSLHTITGEGIGGDTEGELVRLRELKIGPFTLQRPIGELSLAEKGFLADGRSSGLIGGEVWSRFSLIFDFRRQVLYLKPNRQFSKPFGIFTVGLATEPCRGGHIVRKLLPGSPAEEAGIKVGDTIVAFNGKLVSHLTGQRWYETLRRPPGTKLSVRIRSKRGRERTVTVTLRDYL